MKAIMFSLCLIVASLAATMLAGAEQPTAAGAAEGCAQCGCQQGLVPVCHTYCEMKKVLEFRYTCTCDVVAVPQPSPRCSCNDSSACAPVECKPIRRLVKTPVVTYVPVQKCRIDWVCPQCGNIAEAAPAVKK